MYVFANRFTKTNSCGCWPIGNCTQSGCTECWIERTPVKASAAAAAHILFLQPTVQEHLHCARVWLTNLLYVVSVRLSTHPHTHTPTHPHTPHPHTHTPTHPHTHTHTRTHAHDDAHTQAHAHAHPHTYPHGHTHTHTRTEKRTSTQACAHTHAHALSWATISRKHVSVECNRAMDINCSKFTFAFVLAFHRVVSFATCHC
jgi:hypothetical protein